MSNSNRRSIKLNLMFFKVKENSWDKKKKPVRVNLRFIW